MYVDNEANLNAVQPDGSTKRKHLQSIARQTGKVPPELEKAVAVPHAGYGLLDYYVRISAGRTYNSEGNPLPLSYQDILAWCQLTNTQLTEYEVDGIKQMDITSINNSYKKK